MEKIAGEQLLDKLPPQLRKAYEAYVLEEDEDVLPIVKAADKLSAYIKCIQEVESGNREFESALVYQEEALKNMKLPEVEIFLREFLPAFRQDLDHQ